MKFVSKTVTETRDMDKIVRGQKATRTEWDAALQRS